MCGRYASAKKAEDLAEAFGIRPDAVTGEVAPDWNVAPTKEVYAVVERRPREHPEEPPVRQLRVAKWGLVPSWAKDPGIGSRLINARIETVAEKPAFRRAFAARRCLLPADGYYEWYAGTGPDGRPRKQPFFIRPRGGGVLAMAGLYEFWRAPDAEPDDPSAWLTTVTVVTTEATDAVGRIHDRMPMSVPPERWSDWLDPARSDGGELTGLLVPASPDLLEAYPVSTAVSNVRNNGPQLVEPLPAEEAEKVEQELDEALPTEPLF